MPALHVADNPKTFVPGAVSPMTNRWEGDTSLHLVTENRKDRPHVLIVEDSRTQAAMLRLLLMVNAFVRRCTAQILS